MRNSCVCVGTHLCFSRWSICEWSLTLNSSTSGRGPISKVGMFQRPYKQIFIRCSHYRVSLDGQRGSVSRVKVIESWLAGN